MPPIRRFELAGPQHLEVIDGDVAIDQEPNTNMGVRIVDDKGRITVVKHRYHVGVYLAGEKLGSSPKTGC